MRRPRLDIARLPLRTECRAGLTGPARNFVIRMQCSGSQSGWAARVHHRLTGVTRNELRRQSACVAPIGSSASARSCSSSSCSSSSGSASARSSLGRRGELQRTAPTAGTRSPTAAGSGCITIIVALVAVAISAGVLNFKSPVQPGVLVAGLGALSAILILYRIIHHPSAGTSGTIGGVHYSASVGIKIGIWLGLIAALGVTYGGYLAHAGRRHLAGRRARAGQRCGQRPAAPARCCGESAAPAARERPARRPRRRSRRRRHRRHRGARAPGARPPDAVAPPAMGRRGAP